MTGTMLFTWNGIRSARSAEALRAYLEEWVYGVADRDAYWQKLGEEAHARLSVPSRPAADGGLWRILTCEYSAAELMTINSARLLRDGDVVFVGVGLPNLACNLARRTHAPNLYMIYEAGVIGARPARLPLSIGDPTLVSGAAAVCSMYDVFTFYLQRGNVDVGFLGGAQIDRFGNINATVIGDYAHPKVRLPGSGGSMEIAAWANRCYIMTPHQKRRFPEKVDFQTSAGFCYAAAASSRAGSRCARRRAAGGGDQPGHPGTG